MKDLLPIMITGFSVIAALTFLVSTIIEERKYKKTIIADREKTRKKTIEREVCNSEYHKICEITKPIESDRHANTGIPYEEYVYLNRANDIRNNTSLFKWIN